MATPARMFEKVKRPDQLKVYTDIGAGGINVPDTAVGLRIQLDKR